MTTSIQVFVNEQFGQIRTVLINGEPWFIATDVCTVLDIQNPSDALKRLEDDERSRFNLGRQGEANIINESGLYRFIFASRKAEAKAFQRWIYHEVLPSIRKTGSYSIQKDVSMSPLEAVDQVIEIAARLQKIRALKDGIAIAHAVDIVEPFYGNTLEPIKKILPPAEHDTGFLNPTQIGERLGGLPPQAVNKILSANDLQYKSEKGWRLTEYGDEYAEEVPFTQNGHSGYQIRWNESIVDFLKNGGAKA